jgi:hypothetical protein
MKNLYILLFTVLMTSLSFGQLYQEDFETNTNGTNYNTSIPEFSDGSSDFLIRTDGSGISTGYVVSGTNNSFYFAGQDIDGEGAAIPVNLSTFPIDVTGLTAIDFVILLAEDDDGSSQDWDNPDYVHITYSIDGGVSQNLLWIEGDGSSGTAFNSTPRIDTDFDGTGDGSEITSAFSEFEMSDIVIGGGSSIVFTIEFFLNGGDEDLAIDNIRVFDSSPDPDPTDCVLSEWSDWSVCDATCGVDGIETRTRTILVTPANGGLECGPLEETRVCTIEDTTPPTVNCPSDITVNNNPGECGAIVTFELTVTDNCSGGGDVAPNEALVISGVVDGPLSGGTPKAIEFYVVSDIADLSDYGFGSANNGGGTDGQEYTFSGSASAGDFIYIASETTEFNNFFGFAPDGTSSAANINGDDAIELFYDGSVIDVFGDINVDGTGQPWEHLDGWAYRADETGPDGSAFTLANWTFSGPNALDGETTNGAAATPFPIGTYTPTTSNNSPIITTSKESGSFFDIGTTEVTVTATDAAGNTAECSFNVTVEDGDAPTAVCQNITVVLDASGNATIVAADIDNGSNDTCGDVTLAIDKSSFSCDDVTIPEGNQVWINEFHYDNSSTDVDEFIEVVSNFDASVYSIVLYNGNNGESYNSNLLSTAALTNDSGYNFYVINYPSNGIQNGAPDGIALVDDLGEVKQFLSYESSPFEATNGPASGMTSTDIGVSENSSTPVGQSLQLTGTGFQASDFTWSGPTDDTPGTVNEGQSIGNGIEVMLTVTDESSNQSTCVAFVTVVNDTPEITSLTLPNDPVDISNQVDGSATFDDDNIVSATWDWGDLTTSNGVISGNSISGDHVYGEPGVYEVALTIVDICGLEDTEVFQYVVIYDPSGGFVTGGGWIDSPAGAYVPDPTLTGTANFGFVSKYKKGQTVPDGNTEFQFQAGDLNFKSKEYYWLIVAGKKGKFKGNGTINNEGDYDFMITAIDGGTGNNAGDDKLRMKIWDANSEVVIYDNELGNGETDDPTTVIGGGSIIVHKGKNKNSNSEPIINLVGDEFSVWPNPSSSHFNLKLNLGTNETAQLQVHDVNGKLIYKNGQITSQNYQFGETLVSGLYFATLIQKDQVRTIKLIKR